MSVSNFSPYGDGLAHKHGGSSSNADALTWRAACLKWRALVLKIQNASDGDLLLLVVSGRLYANNLVDLATALDAQRMPAALDLKDLVLVDADAVRFLCACERAGVALRNCPRYIRTWLDRERTEP